MLSTIKSLAASATTSGIKAQYAIDAETGFMAGAWLCQDAVSKKAHDNKRQVSVLSFSRKTLASAEHAQSLSSSRSGAAGVKALQEEVFQRLKSEAATLARLRHPGMLEVVESIEESRNSLTFVTERVTGCLGSMVADADDDRASFSSSSRRKAADKLDEIEIQKGLLQITIGLDFLQSTANMVHGNLVPEAIFINSKGDWKIGGFGFATSLKDAGGAAAVQPDYDNRIPRSVQRNLDYAAPEFVIDEQLDPLNDMYSLGCLVTALVSQKRKPPIDSNQNLHIYRKQVETLNLQALQGVPPYLREVIPQLLTRRPATRLSAQAFATSPFFDNILMNAIRFLDAFPEKTASERQAFLRGLPGVIPQFSPRVLTKKILPALLDQLLDAALIPFVLPNVFLITQDLDMPQRLFSEVVLPRLKPIFTMASSPTVLHMLLEKLAGFKQKVSAQELKDDVMQLVYTALATDVPYLQERALKESADLVSGKDLDLVTVKSTLFPKIGEVCAKTTMLGVKVQALQTLDVLVVSSLDKFTIADKLMPMLSAIKSREPAVAMATLQLCRSCAAEDKMDHESIAAALLPTLWTMSLGSLLNKRQFAAFAELINDVGARVQREHAKKLQDGPLGSIGPAGAAGAQKSDDLMDTGAGGGGEDISFEKLVLGGKPKPASQMQQQQARDPFASNDSFASRPPATSGATTSASAFNWSTPPLQPQPFGGNASSASLTASRTATVSMGTGMGTNVGMGRSTGTGMGMGLQPALQPQPASTATTAARPNYSIDSGSGGIDWSKASSANVRPAGSSNSGYGVSSSSNSGGGGGGGSFNWSTSTSTTPSSGANRAANGWSSQPATHTAATSGWSLPPPPAGNGNGNSTSMAGTGMQNKVASPVAWPAQQGGAAPAQPANASAATNKPRGLDAYQSLL